MHMQLEIVRGTYPFDFKEEFKKKGREEKRREVMIREEMIREDTR